MTTFRLKDLWRHLKDPNSHVRYMKATTRHLQRKYDKDKKKTVKEDAPTNSIGAGNMSGSSGAVAGYSPFLFKHKKFKRARHKLRKFGDVTK